MKTETREKKDILNEKWHDAGWLQERLPFDRRTISKMMNEGFFGPIILVPVGQGQTPTKMVSESGYLNFLKTRSIETR